MPPRLPPEVPHCPRGAGGPWQMPGKHCSPHAPPQAIWKVPVGPGHGHLERELRLEQRLLAAAPAGSMGARGSRPCAAAAAACLYLTPRSISK